MLAHVRDADRARRRRVRLDAERADARAQGRRALGQPVARARVPRRGVPRAVRAPLRRGRPARPLPRAQAARAPGRDRARGLGPRARGAALHRRRSTTASRRRSRRATSRCAAAASTARWTSSRCCARERASRIVLHTHMPYVEGFGTWPFGEEWLWEAIATSYLPLLDVLDAHPGRVTLSMTPVLCDQLEAPGALERCLAFLRERPARVAPARHRRPRTPGVAASSSTRARRYAAAADALERRGDLIARVRAARDAGRRPPPTPCCRCWPPTPACGCSCETGIASHRARFGDWDGGFWLPECAHAPWLDELLEEAGVHAHVRRLDRRARARGTLAAPAQAGVAARPARPRGDRPRVGARRLPVARAPTATRTGSRARSHRRGRSTARPTTRTRGARRRATRRARTSSRGSPAAAGCRVALDTELLGHYWHEGVDWLRAVIARASARGRARSCRSTRARRRRGRAGGRPADELGRRRATCAPGAAGGRRAGVASARAELRALRPTPRPSDRALRELLALQALRLGVPDRRGTAGAVPARARRRPLARARATALADPPTGPRALRDLAQPRI